MIRKRKKPTEEQKLIPIPATLPPLREMAAEDERISRRGRRSWIRTVAPALIVTLVVVFVLGAGLKGVLDGLKDRAAANRQLAEEHHALGLVHLKAGEYELAVAEFEVARRYDPDLPDLAANLQEAERLAQAQVTPTSETRRDAASALYQQAVDHYEAGNLEQAVSALEELRELDADYQRENVQIMLVTAHYQLGLNAAREDRLDSAKQHLEAVLALGGDAATEKNAQEQLNLLNLYSAALSHWEQDWSATIQALKGLYTLAPTYKDVRVRLHDAYVFHGQELAEQGDWCRASLEYAAALQVFPLEATADRRDDAEIQCRATAEAASAVPTPRPTARPTSTALPAGAATKTPAPPTGALGKGRIAFPAFDALRQRHDVLILDLAKGSATLLRENANQPAFSPNGARLAVRNEDPAHLGLTIVELANGTARDMTAHFEDSAPTWSPDGSQIVFASSKYGDGRWRIYVISPDATKGEGEQWAFGQTPAWSPDGDEIVYRGCDLSGNNCSLWVMAPGGFDQMRLTSDANDTSPAWSPDSSQVAFASSRTGNWELYAVDAGSGQERRLTEHPALDVAPAWSPDGKSLAFLSNREGQWAVYILNAKTGQVQKAIDAGDAYPDPVGERMVWLP